MSENVQYHSFIGTMMNELGISFVLPDKMLDETNRAYMKRISEYLDRNYYSNCDLLKGHERQIEKYDAIDIDEIQDYIRPWMDIVRGYFLSHDGEYYLLGRCQAEYL